MRSTTSNIFRTSLAVHRSSLSARRRMRVGNRRVASHCCRPTGSWYGTRGMEASSRVVVDPELWKIS